MEGKKRYVAVVLFLLIGLTLFTFANPVEEQKDSKNDGTNKPEISDKDTNTNEGTLDIVENQNQNPTPVYQVVDNTYENALAAVQKAETTLDEIDVEEARNLIEEITNQNQKDELTERLDNVEDTIETIKLVEELEKKVEESDDRKDIEDARDYRTEKEIVEKIDALKNKDIQDSLKNRLQILSRILDDNTAPKYEGVTDGETTKEDVSMTYSDTDEETGTENEVQVKVTLNGEEIDFTNPFTKEGTYVVILTDEAFNETRVTFTIDKTANRITFTSLSTDNSHVDGKVYYVKNGNTITFRMGVREKFATNPNVTIGDMKVELEYVKYFEQPNHHEYKGTVTIPTDEEQLTEGVLPIKISEVTDLAGNEGFYYQTNGKQVLTLINKNETTNGKSVIYDNTVNFMVFTSFNTSRNKVDENKVYYVTNGDTVTLSLGVREKFATSPVVTLGGKEVTLTYNKYFPQPNHYEYNAEITIDETIKLVDGKLQFTISNVTDTVGNEGFIYQYKNSAVITNISKTITTNGKSVLVDMEAPTVIPSYTQKEIIEGSVIEFTDFPTFEIKDNAGLMVSQELIENNVNPAQAGEYKLVYRFTDELGNYTDVTIAVKVIKEKPVITGIVDGEFYNTKDTHAIPTVTGKNIKRFYLKSKIGDNEVAFPWISGKEVTQYGIYTLVVEDKMGNTTEVDFVVDDIAPIILLKDEDDHLFGPSNEIKPIIIEQFVNEIIVKKDGTVIDYKEGDKLTESGKYEMTVTDKAGNESFVEFTICKANHEHHVHMTETNVDVELEDVEIETTTEEIINDLIVYSEKEEDLSDEQVTIEK